VGWSYRIATVRGIDVKIHATFVLIVLLVAGNWSSLGLAGLAFGAALMLLLFACVTLHEFGHALAAQRFGIPVRKSFYCPSVAWRCWDVIRATPCRNW
jgi:stage IV sporulation protein FB